MPNDKGGQDVFGAYDVAQWPKPLSTLPGHEKWTWGAGQYVFAESPNRVFVLQRGELPNDQAAEDASSSRRSGRASSSRCSVCRWRDATTASPPGALFEADGRSRRRSRRRQARRRLPLGAHHHVVDAQGNIIEDWTQWDKMFRRPHSVYISPYDPQKNVWIVDDYRHAIFKFSNDGKKLLQTIGTPNVPGADDKHFYRPTFMAWLPDGTFYVADGYANTRVVKFDKNGKYVMTWGAEGRRRQGDAAELLQQRPRRRRRSADAARVRQRSRQPPHPGVRRERQVPRRVELRPRRLGHPPRSSSTATGILWASDRGTSKMLKFDSTATSFTPGARGAISRARFWGVHGMSVDQEGNVYVGRGG